MHKTSGVKFKDRKSMSGSAGNKLGRACLWSDIVEEAYRFQLAGYRDEAEYLSVNHGNTVDRWPHNNYVKKLQRKDGRFYYYDKVRECHDKDLAKVKLYTVTD